VTHEVKNRVSWKGEATTGWLSQGTAA